MSKPIPQIQKYMTTTPHTVGADQSLAKAAGLMRQHHIRHLPVLSGGKLVGLLSERDVGLVESLFGEGDRLMNVDDVMTNEVYTVSPESPLDEVTSTMAEHKYGSAVVVQNHKVVGIFTAVDACRALSELLETRLRH